MGKIVLTADYADIADGKEKPEAFFFYPCHPRNPRFKFHGIWRRK
jgi:hypothetical protein